MSNPKRKVTDLLPSEAILISSDAERDAVLKLMDDAGMKWATGDKPSEWKSKRPYPYCIFTYDLYKTCTLCLSTLNEAQNERATVYPATDFIPTESDEVKVSNFWKKLSEEKPNSYKTGHWDGKMSDTILFADLNGLFYVGKCYQGIMDGSEYIDFYDQNDFEVHNVTHWAKIPSLF